MCVLVDGVFNIFDGKYMFFLKIFLIDVVIFLILLFFEIKLMVL